MSKADSSPSTAMSPAKSRQAVIPNTEIDRPHALPVAVAIGPLSPEFRNYLAAVQAHYDACDAPEPDFAARELLAWEAATDDASHARAEARLAIQTRPVCSWQDFVELAIVVRQELWQHEPDGTWIAHSMGGELEEAFMRAVFLVIEGGANV